ncbi:MAG TPA: saccharopine dehydrogenase, partial [Burkholderiaceae bacterium]
VAVALDRWWPTAGTHLTGERNQVPRVVRRGGELVRMALPAERSTHAFSPAFGDVATIELPFSEIVTLSHHLAVPDIRSWLSASSLDEIRDASTPAPAAVDARGRSAQRFEMIVQARRGSTLRTASARGQDIYAVSAPLVVEAARRLAAPGADARGALTLGQAFDAGDFLAALVRQGELVIDLPGVAAQAVN